MNVLKRVSLLLMAIVLSAGMLLPASLTSAEATSETLSAEKTASRATGNDRSAGIRLVKGTYEPGEVIIMFKDDVGESLGSDFTIKNKLTFSDDTSLSQQSHLTSVKSV